MKEIVAYKQGSNRYALTVTACGTRAQIPLPDKLNEGELLVRMEASYWESWQGSRVKGLEVHRTLRNPTSCWTIWVSWSLLVRDSHLLDVLFVDRLCETRNTSRLQLDGRLLRSVAAICIQLAPKSQAKCKAPGISIASQFFKSKVGFGDVSFFGGGDAGTGTHFFFWV